jgi:cytochrome c peroxidase
MHAAATSADHTVTMRYRAHDSCPASGIRRAARASCGIAALALGFAAGCSGGPASDSAPDERPTGGSGASGGNAGARMPWSYSPLGLPSEPDDNRSTPEKVELGRLLFHDPILSRDRATACVTCHSQYWGMGDGLRLGIGVGGTGPSGIGRTGPTTTRRNVPSLWNAAYRTALFWDGRVSSLERQVETPLFDDRELGADRETLMRDIADIAAYRALFAAAFPEPPAVTGDNLARAIASFVRTIVTRDAPYDRYAQGDDKALSGREIRGMFLFNELGCATCHAPPMFGADRFDAVASAASGSLSASDDLGRYEVTGDERDRLAFRVPQLRNLRETGPYFHDGHAPTMKQALHEMAAATNTRDVAEDDLDGIAEFIGKGLMDKARVPERPLSVPSGLPVPADGFVIRR